MQRISGSVKLLSNRKYAIRRPLVVRFAPCTQPPQPLGVPTSHIGSARTHNRRIISHLRTTSTHSPTPSPLPCLFITGRTSHQVHRRTFVALAAVATPTHKQHKRELAIAHHHSLPWRRRRQQRRRQQHPHPSHARPCPCCSPTSGACSSVSRRMPARRTSSTCWKMSSGPFLVSIPSAPPCRTRSPRCPVASVVLQGGGRRRRPLLPAPSAGGCGPMPAT